MGHGHDLQGHCGHSRGSELGVAGWLAANVWAMGRFVSVKRIMVEDVASDDTDGC
jgi:hypothetical protein